MVVGIAKAARAKETEAIKDQIANFRGVFNAVELGGVQGIVILFIGLVTATAGGLDVDVGQAEEALEGALGDGDLLKIGEAHREFLHLPNAAAEAEAAIGDDVPALFVVEADGRIGDDGDEEETDKAMISTTVMTRNIHHGVRSAMFLRARSTETLGSRRGLPDDDFSGAILGVFSGEGVSVAGAPRLAAEEISWASCSARWKNQSEKRIPASVASWATVQPARRSW